MFHGSQETDAPQIYIDNLVVYRGPDRTPPAPPSGLQADPAAGSGLRGLTDRVSALEGRLEIDSGHERGTTITATIPCG